MSYKRAIQVAQIVLIFLSTMIILSECIYPGTSLREILFQIGLIIFHSYTFNRWE